MEPVNVLVVDDDEDMLRFIGETLRNGGMSVAEASGGEAALKQLEAAPPELIVADIQMPGMNGYQLCRQVRAMNYSEIPFIFCSVLGDLPERIQGLKVGADDFVVKPVNPEELLLKTGLLLEKSRRYRSLRSSMPGSGKASMLAGSLKEVSFLDLLQLIQFLSLDDLRIQIRQSHRNPSLVYIQNHLVRHAQMGALNGKKAFFRMLTLNEGTFQVDGVLYDGPPTMDETLTHCLMEGMVHLDEVVHLQESLKLKGTHFRILYSPEIFRRRFGDDTLEMLSLIEEFHDLDAILDHCPLTDLKALRILLELLHTRVIGADAPTPS